MAYAGEREGVYPTAGPYAGNATGATQPVKGQGLSTEQAAAAVVLGSLAALIAIRRGFRGVSVSRATGGLVRS
jgi:hypothetical protein